MLVEAAYEIIASNPIWQGVCAEQRGDQYSDSGENQFDLNRRAAADRSCQKSKERGQLIRFRNQPRII
jgi:hypothetical protein